MIPLAQPFFDDLELQKIKEVLDSRWVSNGPTSREFERRFSEYLEVPKSVAVNSATSALHLSLLASEVKQGDEVIIPDFTFPATGNVVYHVGAKPVLCDINSETFNIDVNKIENLITPKTKAIIPVDCFGNPVNISEISEIASKHNLKVIGDSACALGSKYHGKKLGTFFDFTCFSFHARKIISTGEGGMITAKKQEDLEKVRSLSSHGDITTAKDRETTFTHPEFFAPGYNFRISDILSAVGIIQLSRIDKFIKRRREIAKTYTDLISDLDLEIQKELPNCASVFQSFVVLLPNNLNRDKLVVNLRKNGVGCGAGTRSLSMLPTFEGECLVGNDVFNRALSLPMFFKLKDEEINVVVEKIKQELKGV